MSGNPLSLSTGSLSGIIVRYIEANPFFFICCCILILTVLIVLFTLVFRMGRRIGRLESEKNISEMIRAGRKDAIKRSRAVIGGQMTEQIAPFLRGFPCNPADVRFVGKPIDFVAFPGAAEGREVSEIIFIEVKTGMSVLSKREREIKNAVQAGRVRYVEYNYNSESD